MVVVVVVVKLCQTTICLRTVHPSIVHLSNSQLLCWLELGVRLAAGEVSWYGMDPTPLVAVAFYLAPSTWHLAPSTWHLAPNT